RCDHFYVYNDRATRPKRVDARAHCVVLKLHERAELKVRGGMNHPPNDLPLRGRKSVTAGLSIDDGKAFVFNVPTEGGHLSHVVHVSSACGGASGGGCCPSRVPSKSTK